MATKKRRRRFTRRFYDLPKYEKDVSYLAGTIKQAAFNTRHKMKQLTLDVIYFLGLLIATLEATKAAAFLPLLMDNFLFSSAFAMICAIGYLTTVIKERKCEICQEP